MSGRSESVLRPATGHIVSEGTTERATWAVIRPVSTRVIWADPRPPTARRRLMTSARVGCGCCVTGSALAASAIRAPFGVTQSAMPVITKNSQGKIPASTPMVATRATLVVSDSEDPRTENAAIRTARGATAATNG